MRLMHDDSEPPFTQEDMYHASPDEKKFMMLEYRKWLNAQRVEGRKEYMKDARDTYKLKNPEKYRQQTRKAHSLIGEKILGRRYLFLTEKKESIHLSVKEDFEGNVYCDFKCGHPGKSW